ncbi:MAG: ABC transporter ATP-binding protein [Clostridiales Family XIII bacterium]|jgi:osmoprotectant transport system ATP-binding protein|nr:ABC transporter ATP-binding protein [Clostridiales Family XIII bacterium]
MKEALQFENVVKRFPGADYNAVDHVSLSVEEGALVTILGTSGSGKTTLLKMVNRLYEPGEGRILLHGKDIALQDPVQLRRGIGYVIQQVGLFPHMTVRDNIATVPKILKWENAKIDARVDALLALVNLDPAEYRGRFPAQLSGGQQQRVGLARALAVDPVIMLLDEPFGAIDAINRSTLQDELLSIHRASKKTYLFVTHDIAEAFKLGTHVLIMRDGKVVQYDTPSEIRRAPADDFVEELIGRDRALESSLSRAE